jgi:pyruvate/2-oxoglutarate dehydrogenase complex dihydrolipoamide dehydrogenase (E3) component
VQSDYDLIVVGGGAGGMSAARAARRRGAQVLLVQAGRIGGECTFVGCVPSKALIAAAAAGRPFEAAMRAVRGTVETIAATEDDTVFAGEGIDVAHGYASFAGRGELDVDGCRVRSKRVVVATGSRPAVPPVAGLETVAYLTNETVFDLDVRPGSLAVVGGGAAGCELAQAFARLGAAVTIIERLDRLLPQEEPEASAVIVDVLAAAGIDARTGRTVARVEGLPATGSARLHLDDGSTVDADRLLLAVGRRAETEALRLDAIGVTTERGFIVTDDRLATTAPGVWAVGDVTGKLHLTHAADEMGRVAAGNALSPRWRHRRFDATAIPRVTFTDPEVAHVGVGEANAPAGARVAYVPMAEVDRAVVSGETEGFVKLVVAPRRAIRNAGGGRVVGATIVAARAGELIHEPVLAMRTGMFAGRLAQAVHAYPTWSVAVRQAAAQLFFEVGGRAARPARRENRA